VDAIYDESESLFSVLIDSFRNKTYFVESKEMLDFNYWNPEAKNSVIKIVGNSNFMIYVDVWCRLLLAKMTWSKIVLDWGYDLKYVNNVTGYVCTPNGSRIIGSYF